MKRTRHSAEQIVRKLHEAATAMAAVKLRAERLPEAWAVVEQKVKPRCRAKTAELKSLTDHLAGIPEYRSAHALGHQAANPQHTMLTRASVGQNVKNRAKIMANIFVNKGIAPAGYSGDEYPFASSVEGGKPSSVSVMAAPTYEQAIQGGIIAGSYLIEKIRPGDLFEVVVIP